MSERVDVGDRERRALVWRRSKIGVRIEGVETGLRGWMVEGAMTERPWKKAEKRDCARERRVLWGGGITGNSNGEEGAIQVMQFGGALEQLPRSCSY